MKIALFGIGQMGKCIAYLLKETQGLAPLGIELTTFDQHPENDFPGHYTDKYVECDVRALYREDENPFVNYKPDIILSSLPYFCNLALARVAIQQRIPYFDLGGSVEVSESIHNEAKKHESPVFTDLGLAPGWANIMAEEAFDKTVMSSKWNTEIVTRPPSEIIMRCGGLPRYPDSQDLLGYNLTWSVDGLYNEYKAPSEALCNGAIREYPSLMLNSNKKYLKNTKTWEEGEYGPFESFLTSGGASHTLKLMQDRGVEHCCYETLRYPGHADIINYFINSKKYDVDKFKDLFYDYEGCNDEDIVYLNVEAESEDGTIKYEKTNVIYATEEFSAMQRATAGGFIAAALDTSRIAPGRSKFSSPSEEYNKMSSVMNYSDVDIDNFNAILKRMEILGGE